MASRDVPHVCKAAGLARRRCGLTMTISTPSMSDVGLHLQHSHTDTAGAASLNLRVKDFDSESDRAETVRELLDSCISHTNQ